MKEILESPRSDELIQLPSRLRIKQRLGHVSTRKHFKEQIVPKIAKMGGETRSVDELLGGVSVAFSAYPDNKPGISNLGESQIPKVLHQLVKDPELETHIIDQWNEGCIDGAYPLSSSIDE